MRRDYNLTIQDTECISKQDDKAGKFHNTRTLQMTMAHAGGDQHKGMTLQRKFQEKVNLLEVSVSEILLALVTSFIVLPF